MPTPTTTGGGGKATPTEPRRTGRKAGDAGQAGAVDDESMSGDETLSMRSGANLDLSSQHTQTRGSDTMGDTRTSPFEAASDTGEGESRRADTGGDTSGDKSNGRARSGGMKAAVDQINTAKSALASEIGAFASRIEALAPKEGMLGTAGTSLHAGLAKTQTFLQDRSPADIASLALTMLRRHPMMIVGAVVGAGIGHYLSGRLERRRTSLGASEGESESESFGIEGAGRSATRGEEGEAPEFH